VRRCQALQRPGSETARHGRPHRQPRVQPPTALGKIQVSAGKPDSTVECAHQLQEPFRVAPVSGMGEGAPNVVAIQGKPTNPRPLLGAALVRLHCLGETDVVGQVTVSQRRDIGSG